MRKVVGNLKNFFTNHKGITASITLGGIGSTIFYVYYWYSIKKHLSISTKVLDTEKSKEYIYLAKEKFTDSIYLNPNKGRLSSQTRQYIKEVLPTPLAHAILLIDRKGANLAEDYVSPWKVLGEAYSRNKNIRLRAVETIAAYKHWNDAELCTLAQSIDFVTSVGLARTHDVDLRLFRLPPVLDPLNKVEEIEHMLRELLIKLPQQNMEKCVQYFTSGALDLSDDQQRKKGGLWCFGGNGINYTRSIRPQTEVELLCLQALAKHSVFEDHCRVMVDLGALQLMQRIKEIRSNNIKIQENIVRTISNICLYPQFHSQIYQAGWVAILAEMSQSDSVAIRIQASRGLANLDRETVKEKFHDGICTLYPKYRTKSRPEADVVFVHGLMGGAFYSWRQADNNSSTSSMDQRRTHCWPEEWLPTDLPGCRVMCVDYDTNLSEWLSLCPHENDRRTISYRSRQLLNHALQAGIGDRPIIWITHSMGGLIVKHMLLDAKENPNLYGKILQRTRGIIFFGTPHGGSQLAKYSQSIRKVLFPSVEVMELSHDSPRLKLLNEFMAELVRNNSLKVLSFGETQNTNIGFGKLIKLHIVPPESANPGIGEFALADTNHLNLCKPASRQSSIYQQTIKFTRDSLAPRPPPEEEEADIHQVLL